MGKFTSLINHLITQPKKPHIMKSLIALTPIALLLFFTSCQTEEPEDFDDDPKLPAAEFSITQIDAVTYEFESLQGGSQHAWDFGDGTTNVGKKIEHQYAESGEYEVTLTVSTSEGERIGKKSVMVEIDKTFLLTRGAWRVTQMIKNGKAIPEAIGNMAKYFNNGTLRHGTIDGFTWEWNEDETAIIEGYPGYPSYTNEVVELSPEYFHIKSNRDDGTTYEYKYAYTE